MVGFWTLFWGFAVCGTLAISFTASSYRYRCTSSILAVNWVLWNVGFALVGADTTVAVFPLVDSAATVIVALLALKYNKLWLWAVFLLYLTMLGGYVAYQSNAVFGLGDRVSFLTVMNALFGLQLLSVSIPGAIHIVRTRYSNTRTVDRARSISRNS